MTEETFDTLAVGHRGPGDHAIREQIVEAAEAHFSRYGYNKTTVSDLAKAIGFSKAYVYKFFDSKHAIGQAICAKTLEGLLGQAQEAVRSADTATEKMRRFFSAIVTSSAELFFDDQKLYEIATHSVVEKWPSCMAYCAALEQIVREIVLEGRASGEFERKTPLDETASAIMKAMESFHNPVMLQYQLDSIPDGSTEVVNLILRSLAP
ncbi:TetR/AcrR family transcriptional regulator [Novosphingobium sp. AP12]|uniref:TetR/AcrR family transcriptional regulator n=1 Tax=Novosphingobium sp. AP12 TaxID=1144305 RepID=UPI000271E1C8|nr:TetR/AcrR family transcriptional regulator [Novosphingobium sp. AP12]EJL35446.1 transcriptional regulator [Novosphingobium sp. AP12]